MKKTMNMTGIEIQTLRSAYGKAYDLGREQHMYVMTDQLLHGKTPVANGTLSAVSCWFLVVSCQINESGRG